MKKLFLFSLLLLSVCQTSMVFAHAVITHNSLKNVPIYANRVNKVKLNFNSKIEIGLSQVFLVSKGDQLTPLKIAEGGHYEGHMIMFIPALIPGDYALKIKVFAADGHLTEDLIRFSVTP